MLRSLLLILAVAAAATAQTKKPAPKKEFKVSEVEQAVIDATNKERKAKKLLPLKMNPLLMEAARAHAENMARQSKLAHELDDKTVGDRVTTAKYSFRLVGENVAWNQATAADVVAAWMDSQGHRENILKENYTEIGVAVAKNSKGQPYWCQVFGRPRR